MGGHFYFDFPKQQKTEYGVVPMEILAAIMVLAVISVVFWDDLVILTRIWQSRSEQPSWKKRAVTVLTKFAHSTTLAGLFFIAIPFAMLHAREKSLLETAEAIVFACTCILAYWIIARVPFYFLDQKDDSKEGK